MPSESYPLPTLPQQSVLVESDTVNMTSMPLRPILKKNLTIRSNETGTKADIEEALNISASGKVVCQVKLIRLLDLNIALDRLQAGKVLGKLVIDLQSKPRSLKPLH